MKALSLQGSEDTPQVVLDRENGEFVLAGRSLPENAATFYKPILDWLEAYAQDPNPATVFNFKLDYFNTSSSKMILDILTTLEDIPGARVIWYFHDDDEDMEEAGEEFSELVELPFEWKVY
ncbi:MAG: DUF1987 domain-containing protein [Cyclobacteriaceae bacterium]|nr:DUF1987 domain-containing protein [Cyclobacteriaceae bacterium]